MNYLKSALAGFGMSFIGTALCGSKVGATKNYNDQNKIKSDVYAKLIKIDQDYSCTKNTNTSVTEVLSVNKAFFNLMQKKYDLGIASNNLDWRDFDYDLYYDENLKANQPNYWFYKDGGWSVAKALLENNALCIPTSLLGALFHDKVGRDLTPKINEYFDSEISPYLITGGLFGAISTLGLGILGICISSITDQDPTQPWIYSMSIIEGFLIGATAMAGAYFGDENTQETINQELTDQDNHLELKGN